MTIYYFAPVGELGSLEQAKRECRAMLAALDDPEAAATMMQGMPEALAAWKALHGLRPAVPVQPHACTLVWDSTPGGQVSLAVREIPQ